jgi:hypothetical protein
MELARRLRQRADRMSPLVAVGVGFLAFIVATLGVAYILPLQPRDLEAECRKHCEPRFHRVVPDKNYPMAKGKYPLKCECY